MSASAAPRARGAAQPHDDRRCDLRNGRRPSSSTARTARIPWSRWRRCSSTTSSAGQDVNTFTELVRAPGHVWSMGTATRSEWTASPRYRARHHAPRRARRRAACRARGARAAAGATGACTATTARGFTTAEADVIRRLAPHIAHALRQAILLHRPASDRPHRPGVVLLDEEMELVASTPETDALLPLIGHGSRQLTLPVVVTLSPPCSHL
jgi:hypothetical protein